MEEFYSTQQSEQPEPREERRGPTQGVYNGEERRKADAQLDQMANGQQDG
jgi:hypothetical protein